MTSHHEITGSIPGTFTILNVRLERVILPRVENLIVISLIGSGSD